MPEPPHMAPFNMLELPTGVGASHPPVRVRSSNTLRKETHFVRDLILSVTTLTQDPQMLCFNSITSRMEGTVQRFLTECHDLRFGGADPHPSHKRDSVLRSSGVDVPKGNDG